MLKQSMTFLFFVLTASLLGACGAQQAQTSASQNVTEPALAQDFSADNPNVVFAPVDPNTAPETTPGATQDNNTVPCTTCGTSQNSNASPCDTCTTHGNSPVHHAGDDNSSTGTVSNGNATNANSVIDDKACHGTPQMLGQNGVIRACSQRSVPFHLRGALGDPAAMTIVGPNGYSLSGTARRSSESCEYHFMWSVGTAVEGTYTATVDVPGSTPFVFHVNVQAGSCP